MSIVTVLLTTSCKFFISSASPIRHPFRTLWKPYPLRAKFSRRMYDVSMHHWELVSFLHTCFGFGSFQRPLLHNSVDWRLGIRQKCYWRQGANVFLRKKGSLTWTYILICWIELFESQLALKWYQDALQHLPLPLLQFWSFLCYISYK